MKYEDMSMSQLKSLCRDKGLGTGRSRAELIAKLEAYDSRVVEYDPTDDTDLTEDQIDDMMEKSEPVVIESPEPAPEAEEPEPKDEDPSPTVFRISYSHSGALLDSEHEAYRKRTYDLATVEGLKPYGGEFAARLIKSENGQLTYELEVHG